MAGIFAIKEASKQVAIDDQGRGEVAFTVKNASNRPIRARGEIRPLDSSKASWFEIQGELERDFSIDQSHQFVVKVVVPPGTNPGDYDFRLDIVGVNNPDEDYAEGPAVSLKVPEPKPEEKSFPWWIVVAAGVLLLVVGGVVFFLMLGGDAVVPADLVGKPASDARQILEQAGLTAKEAGQEVTPTAAQGPPGVSFPVPEGTVIRTRPAPGSSVASGGEVELITEGPSVPVPGLTDLKAEAALFSLQRAGLKVGSVNSQRAPQNKLGLVVNQSPKQGIRHPKGGEVDISIGIFRQFGLGDVLTKAELQIMKFSNVTTSDPQLTAVLRSTPTPLQPPQLKAPAENSVLDNFPRRTTLEWDAVEGAESYIVIVEYNDGQWRHLLEQEGLTETSFTFNFSGAQPGRWRVLAVDESGNPGVPSPWREFRYTG